MADGPQRSLPSSADDLTAEWLTDILADATGGAVVIDLATAPIGTGQVAETRRLTMAWDPPDQKIPALVAKVPTTDPTSRNAAKVMRNYAVEVAFYRDIAPTVDVNVPTCYFADHDYDTDDFALILADQAPATQGDQLAGCSPDDAASAVDELVALHAPRWNDDTLADAGLSWLGTGGPPGFVFAQLVVGTFAPFLERYADRLSAELVATIQVLADNLTTYLSERPGPKAVTHNDFRLDNLLFGGERVAVVDWQTVSYGSPLADLSYFIGGSLLPEVRRAHERDLVRRYHEGLVARGIDATWDECWEGYRRFAFDGLLMAVMASMGVERTDRGDDMFMTMAARGGQHALDVDAASYFDA